MNGNAAICKAIDSLFDNDMQNHTIRLERAQAFCECLEAAARDCPTTADSETKEYIGRLESALGLMTEYLQGLVNESSAIETELLKIIGKGAADHENHDNP